MITNQNKFRIHPPYHWPNKVRPVSWPGRENVQAGYHGSIIYCFPSNVVLLIFLSRLFFVFLLPFPLFLHFSVPPGLVSTFLVSSLLPAHRATSCFLLFQIGSFQTERPKKRIATCLIFGFVGHTLHQENAHS